MTALELVCPAGTPAALKAAVSSGADAVYLGFRDATNARNFPGLNFSRDELQQGIDHAHDNGCKIFLAINTFPTAGDSTAWHQAVDDGASLGVDAVILADIGMLDYASRKHPDLRRHLSVQASASNPEAIRFYQDAFDVKRVVLPRVLSVAEIAALNKEIDVETEVFVFGGLCVMAEGRCALSSYATGQSPNCNGVCSPASHVRYERRGGDTVSRLGDFTLNIFSEGEAAGYPTLCKGRFVAGDSALPEWAERFDAWLTDVVTTGDGEALAGYRDRTPDGALAHPRDEHLLPLMVAMGAGGEGARGEVLFRGFISGAIGMGAYAFA